MSDQNTQNIEYVADHFAEETEMHRAAAERALDKLIADAQAAKLRLAGDTPHVHQSIGGAVLNSQYFGDAERSLVRFSDAASNGATVGWLLAR